MSGARTFRGAMSASLTNRSRATESETSAGRFDTVLLVLTSLFLRPAVKSAAETRPSPRLPDALFATAHTLRQCETSV